MKSWDGAETFPDRPGSLLAHQGGWDELLLVLGPLAVVGLLLWLANRRVTAQLDQVGQQETSPDDTKDNPKR